MHTCSWLSQQTREIHPILVYCWSTVCDAGPILHQHWVSIWCSLAWRYDASIGWRSESPRTNPVVCVQCSLTETRRAGQAVCKRQYLLTCKVSRYCFLALHGRRPYNTRDAIFDAHDIKYTDFQVHS